MSYVMAAHAAKLAASPRPELKSKSGVMLTPEMRQHLETLRELGFTFNATPQELPAALAAQVVKNQYASWAGAPEFVVAALQLAKAGGPQFERRVNEEVGHQLDLVESLKPLSTAQTRTAEAIERRGLSRKVTAANQHLYFLAFELGLGIPHERAINVLRSGKATDPYSAALHQGQAVVRDAEKLVQGVIDHPAQAALAAAAVYTGQVWLPRTLAAANHVVSGVAVADYGYSSFQSATAKTQEEANLYAERGGDALFLLGQTVVAERHERTVRCLLEDLEVQSMAHMTAVVVGESLGQFVSSAQALAERVVDSVKPLVVSVPVSQPVPKAEGAATGSATRPARKGP